MYYLHHRIDIALMQRMTDFCQIVSMSRLRDAGKEGASIPHTAELNGSLYGVIKIQPLVYLHREIISIFAK